LQSIYDTVKYSDHTVSNHWIMNIELKKVYLEGSCFGLLMVLSLNILWLKKTMINEPVMSWVSLQSCWINYMLLKLHNGMELKLHA